MRDFIFNRKWTSIIFENRNQAYGAFLLRREYEKNLVFGLLGSNSALALIFGFVFASKYFISTDVKSSSKEIVYTFTEVEIIPKSKIVIPPPTQTAQKQKVNSKRFVEAVVVPDEQVQQEMNTIDELKNATISTQNQIGDENLAQNAVISNAAESIENIETEKEQIVEYAEVMPSFPDEYGSFKSYINTRLQYPKKALDNGIGGRVLVQFIVNEDGSISNIEIVRGLGFGLDEEVKRVVALMPNWHPAKVNGKPVKLRLTMPVHFVVNE